MRTFVKPLIAAASAALSIVAATDSTDASLPKDIIIDLKAEWSAVPFQLELVEAIAAENSSVYHPLLLELATSEDLEAGSSDKLLYHTAIKFALDNNYITESSVPFIDLALGLHKNSAKIQAFYQYHDSVAANPASSDTSNCPVWVHYNKKFSCDSDTVFALETKSDGSADDSLILVNDRVFGARDSAPIAILYADISHPSFPVFHKHLYHSAENGKIRYILRYRKPLFLESDTTSKAPAQQPLAGYGVELYVKRTDYLVIDDRDVKSDNNEAESSPDSSAKSIELKAADEGATIKKQNIPRIGLKGAGFIMNSENKFASLVNISLDFPRYSHSISELPLDRTIQKELADKFTQVAPGANLLYINGAPVTQPNDDIFTIANAIERERGFFSLFEELGIDPEAAIQLITTAGSPEKKSLKNDADVDDNEDEDEDEDEDEEGEPKKYARLTQADISRFDYRSSSLLWINDLAKDSQYRRWSTSLSQYLGTGQAGFFPVRHNTHTLIYAFDPSNQLQVRSLYDLLHIWQRNVPIQVALLPIPYDKVGFEIATEMYAIHDNGKNRRGLLQYLSKFLSGTDHDVACSSFMNVKKYKFYPEIFKDEEIKKKIEAGKELASNLDIETAGVQTPTLIINGIFVNLGVNWFQEMALIMKTDSELIRDLIKDGEIDEDDTDIVLKDVLLQDASPRRNRMISVSDPSSIVYNSIDEIYEALWPNNHTDVSNNVVSFVRNRIPENTENPDFLSTFWIFGKSHTESFIKQVIASLTFLSKSEASFRVNIVPLVDPSASRSQQQTANAVNTILFQLTSQKADIPFSQETFENIHTALFGTSSEKSGSPTLAEIQKKITPEDSFSTTQAHYDQNYNIVGAFKTAEYREIQNSDVVVVSAGRVLPLPSKTSFNAEDLLLLQDYEFNSRVKSLIRLAHELNLPLDTSNDGAKDTGNHHHASYNHIDKLVSLVSKVKFNYVTRSSIYNVQTARLDIEHWDLPASSFEVGNKKTALIHLTAVIDPLSEKGQVYVSYLKSLLEIPYISAKIILNPKTDLDSIPLKRFYRACLPIKPTFDDTGAVDENSGDVVLSNMPQSTLLYIDLDVPPAWIVMPKKSVYDLDNIILDKVEPDENGSTALRGTYELKHILIEGHATDITKMEAPRGVALNLSPLSGPYFTDTIIMENLGYLQLKTTPGLWKISLKEGLSSQIFDIVSTSLTDGSTLPQADQVWVTEFTGVTIMPKLKRKWGMEAKDVLAHSPKAPTKQDSGEDQGIFKLFENAGKKIADSLGSLVSGQAPPAKKNADINIFSVASGHLYERFLSIMTYSVTKHTNHTVKFWIIENFLSPKFKDFLPYLAKERGFEYELVTYKWPHWLRGQTEKQRTIWGYKILFLDVLFPQSLDKIIFVDADQIVRTDMYDLVELDLEGAPYGFTPMCDSRKEIEGFRFWKQGYWERYLGHLKYHISALYVVDLVRFRELAAGDMLRQHYQMLSADPGSLSNLDQDLPNHLQKQLPIFSLPQDWLWCETWCSDESLATAKTIDLCNNPMTKEPKLDRARRQLPEWTVYDDQVAALDKKVTKLLEDAALDAPDLVPDTHDESDEEDELDDDEILQGAEEVQDAHDEL